MLTEKEARDLGVRWLQDHDLDLSQSQCHCADEWCVFVAKGKVFGVNRLTGEQLEEGVLQHIVRTELGWLL